MRINSKEELQSKKAEIEQNIQSFTCRVLVCSGTGCMASGAQKIYDEMVRLCEGIDGVEIEMQKDIPHVGVIKTGCQGLCELGPLVRIEPYGYQYVHVQEEDCLEIVERTVRLGHPVDRLFYRHGDEVCPKPEDIPFLNRQTRIVLENCGKIDAESIDEYIAAGGLPPPGSYRLCLVPGRTESGSIVDPYKYSPAPAAIRLRPADIHQPASIPPPAPEAAGRLPLC